MLSVLLYSLSKSTPPPDLSAAGLQVMAGVQCDGLCGPESCANLVHAVQSGAPDALLWVQSQLSAGLFNASQAFQQTALALSCF